MAKIELSTLTSGYNLTKINENFQKLEDALNDEVLYRDNPADETNTIESDIDFNNNRILNLPDPISASEPIRKQEWDEVLPLASQYRDEAEEFAEEAEAWSEVAKSVAGDASVVTLSSIEELSSVAVVLEEGRRLTVTGYHEGTTVGGGDFIVEMAVHNGGTNISLTKAFPEDWSDDSLRSSWLTNSGVTELCLVRLGVSDTILPTWFGSDNSETTDGTSTINASLGVSEGKVLDLTGSHHLVEGLLVIGDNVTLKGGTLDFNNSTGNAVRVLGDNVTIEDITFTGTAPGLINPRDGATNLTVQNCIFDSTQGTDGRLSQIIWLFECSNIKVLNNNFISSGYGVITQVGYASDDVLIAGNYIVDSYNDFVEANSASVECKNWTISNNIYKGGNGWPTVQTERRFVGITEVSNVLISNNIVENVCGDAAIHLEDSYGDTVIDGNIFENWVGNSCVYILQVDEDTIISNNIFKRTEAVDMPDAISTSSGSYDHTISILGNRFEDFIDDEDRFVPIRTTYSGRVIIANNQARNCEVLCYINNVDGTIVSGNKTTNCTGGILSNINVDGSRETGSGGSDVSIIGNNLEVTNPTYGIYSTTNISGTNGPKQWFVTGNHTNGNITLANTSGSVGQTLWNTVYGNYLRDGATVGVSNAGSTGLARASSDGNFYEGDGGDGWSGTYTSGTGSTVTVVNGVITDVT